MQILIMAYMIPFSISTAGCIYIGQLLGANKAEKAENVFKVVLTTCCK
jgi:Na+-driven multidrug efflux pump